jgi:hypothetical protein
MSNATPFNHNNVANSVSRLWKKRILNTIVKNAKNAGYDVVATNDTIIVGELATDTIHLKALRGTGAWLVRYNTQLFQDHP